MTGMGSQQSPVLVRREPVNPVPPPQRGRPVRRLFRILLLLVGLFSLGYYCYTLVDQNLYEGYQNWAFDHEIAGGGPVEFSDYLRQATPLGWILGRGEAVPSSAVQKAVEPNHPAPENAPAFGSVLGRIIVPRLHIEAVVREGVSSSVLSTAVGHVPATALAGRPGNFAIAAHRDTLFRALKDIQTGDLVKFQGPDRSYTYEVVSTRIVKPTEVSVLRPDGALPSGALQKISFEPGSSQLITLITCYPFYYVGSAPERFIVQGRLVAGNAAQPAQARAGPPHGKPVLHAARARQAAFVQKPRTVRGFSHLHTESAATQDRAGTKKRGFWKRLLHRS